MASAVKPTRGQEVYSKSTFCDHDDHFEHTDVDPLAAISLEHIFNVTPNTLLYTPSEEGVPTDPVPLFRCPAYYNLQAFLTTGLGLATDNDHFAMDHPQEGLERLTEKRPMLYNDTRGVMLNISAQAHQFQHDTLAKFDSLSHDIISFCDKMNQNAGPKGYIAQEIELIKTEMHHAQTGSPALRRGALMVKTILQRLARASDTVAQDVTSLLNDTNHFHGLAVSNYTALSNLYDSIFTNDAKPEEPSLAKSVQPNIQDLRDKAMGYAELYQSKRNSLRVSTVLAQPTEPIGNIVPFGTVSQTAVGYDEVKPVIRARREYLAAQADLMKADPTQGPIFAFFDMITQIKAEMSELHHSVDDLLKILRVLKQNFDQCTTELTQLSDEIVDAAQNLERDDAFMHTFCGIDLAAAAQRYGDVKQKYLDFITVPNLDWVIVDIPYPNLKKAQQPAQQPATKA